MPHRVLALGLVAAAAFAQQPTENCAVTLLVPLQASTLCPQSTAQDSTTVLDLPASNTWLSLCGTGYLEVQLGVMVVDGPGPDFQIEEENPNLLEPFAVDVSPDYVNWFPIAGPYAGGAWAGDSAIDLAGSGTATALFVRVTDLSAAATGSTPGPDIDAFICINYLPPTFGGVARPYADVLVDFVPGVMTAYSDGTRALGPPDAYRAETWIGPGNTTFGFAWNGFVSMPAGAVLSLGFSEHFMIDGPAGDLIVHEYYSPEGGLFTVEASDDGFNWVPMTLLGSVSPIYGNGAVPTNNVQAFDLAGSGLVAADYVRIVSTSTATTGTTPGSEVDAVEAVNFVAKPRRLRTVQPLALGATGVLDLAAPLHAGETAVTLAALTPPAAPGLGLPIAPGIEYRLSLADPVVSFILTDPLAPLLFTNTVAVVPPAGNVGISLFLPNDPILSGLVLWWESALVGAGAATGVSNILRTAVP